MKIKSKPQAKNLLTIYSTKGHVSGNIFLEGTDQ